MYVSFFTLAWRLANQSRESKEKTGGIKPSVRIRQGSSTDIGETWKGETWKYPSRQNGAGQLGIAQGGRVEIARALLLGIPSSTSYLWSILAVALNDSLALLAADMVYRVPLYYKSQDLSFARVGYVSDNAAGIF